MALLEVEDLHVEFPGQGATMHAVEGVEPHARRGRRAGHRRRVGVGQERHHARADGAGAPSRAACAPGALRFAGHDLLNLSVRERRKLTGKDVAMIFQDPTTSLNPCFTVGFQLTETLRLHLGLDRVRR